MFTKILGTGNHRVRRRALLSAHAHILGLAPSCALCGFLYTLYTARGVLRLSFTRLMLIRPLISNRWLPRAPAARRHDTTEKVEDPAIAVRFCTVSVPIRNATFESAILKEERSSGRMESSTFVGCSHPPKRRKHYTHHLSTTMCPLETSRLSKKKLVQCNRRSKPLPDLCGVHHTATYHHQHNCSGAQ